MEGKQTSILLLLIFAMGGLVSGVNSQEVLRYTLQEERADTQIADIFTDSGLVERYTASELTEISLVFVESDEAHENLFNLRGRTLETKGSIDRDQICPYLEQCILHVSIKVGPVEYFEIIRVEVVLVDINDNAPRFESGSQELTISESRPVGSIITTLPQAVDPDSPVFSVQDFQMIPSSAKFRLYRQTVSGIMRVQLEIREELDREMQGTYTFTLWARDGGTPAKNASISITIRISDSNDNRPVFERASYNISVSESSPIGFPVVRVVANDADVGNNARVEYSFDASTTNEHGALFRIDSQTGDISLRARLDYERRTKHVLTILATDNYPDFAGALAEVTVNIIDANDNAPSIRVNDLLEGQQVQVPENEGPGYFVAYLTVSDADQGINGEFNCSIDDNFFKLEPLYPTEYKITTDVPFDRETRLQYTIRMGCVDNGSPTQRSDITIPVIITDKNDQTPTFQTVTFVGHLPENNNPGAFITRIRATDNDIGRNGEIEYHIDGEANATFEVGLLSGNISARVRLDHELQEQYEFIVRAVDRGIQALSATATVIIDVLDIDDNPPLFSHSSYAFTVPENSKPGTEIEAVYASDNDSPPFDHFQYFMNDSDHFRIDTANGSIYTRGTLDRETYETPVFGLKVYAISSYAQRQTSTAYVTIHITDENDNRPLPVFPNDTNNTLRADSSLRRGEVIGQVVATDIDTGNNGRLSYTFIQGNEERFFLIDAVDGTVMAHQSLSNVVDRRFQTKLQIQDGGQPPLSIDVNLTIEVYRSEDNVDVEKLRRTNLSIVVSIACVSGIIIVLLIVAIVCIIVQRRRHKRERHYNNVPKVLGSDAFKQLPSTAVKSSNGPAYNGENEHGGFENVGFTGGPMKKHGKKQDGRNSDQNSMCSADVSNTDSGRGSNEDCSHEKIRNAAALEIAGPSSRSQLSPMRVPSTQLHAQMGDNRHNISDDSVRKKKKQRFINNGLSIDSQEGWNINTAHLQSGAYHVDDNYKSHDSFNVNNAPQPSPLLDDALYGDRRRQILYRHVSKTSGQNMTGSPISGATSNYVTPGQNTRLHEVHV